MRTPATRCAIVDSVRRPAHEELRGEESGLSDEEIAFYDALAENERARQAMGDPALRVIATELVRTWIRYPRTLKPELWTGGARSVRARSA